MTWTRWAIGGLVLALLLMVPLGARAEHDEKLAYEQARQEYFRLSRSPTAKAKHYNWQRAAERFTSIYMANPHGDHAVNCLWWMGRVHAEAFEQFKTPEDFNQAVDIYRRITNHFPKANLADDAQYALGQLYEIKGEPKLAYLEYLKVTVNYPRGDQVAAAKNRLDALEEQIRREKGQVPQQEPAARPPANPNANGNGLAAVGELRHWSTPSYTRVVMSVARPVPFTSKVMVTDDKREQPRRLYLDLRGARVAGEAAKPMAIGDGLLRSARAEQLSPDVVRLALDIQSLGSYKVFTLDNPFRVVVDCFATAAPSAQAATLARAGDAAPSRQAKGKSKAHPEPPPLKAPPERKLPRGQAQQQPNELGLAAQLGLRVKRVILDPGHGGKDPGASFRGLVEKDLTLDVAKRAAPKIAKLLGAEVLMTRTGDVFVPLEDRTAFANTHDADLFVSIHTNAAPSSNLSGLETYFLNLATDEESMRVAARENATTKRSISDLQNILNDLMLNSKINESNRLARTLHKDVLSNVRKQHKVADLKVKQAPFYVLIGARMPAVLIEIGFITNPQEHTRLATPAYRDQLAEGLAQGLAAYARHLKVPDQVSAQR